MSDEIFRLLPRFINDINLTQPEYNFSDRIWQFPMRFGPNSKDWTMVHVTRYEKTYYCYWSEWNLSLELSTKGKIKKPAFWSLANFRHFKGAIKKDMSGLEMYKRLADGRHEGLVELPLESADKFKQWYHSGRGGGHPWEVYRGGNTTHIDLGVNEKAGGWSLFLSGSSTSRMVETIRIALALENNGLPVEIHDAEELRSRLLGLDNMGIIPKFILNHWASQNFEKGDKVYDCAHLHDLSRKNWILPFISWKPIDPIRPRIV